MFNNNIQLKLKFWRKVSAVLFGLFLCVLLLEVSLRIGGFILLSIQEHRKVILAQKKGTYRILCLGESTTAGQYPSYLEENLNQRNIRIKFNVIDRGVSGTTSKDILSQLEDNVNKYQPDMVITMMGINDKVSDVTCKLIFNSGIINFLKSSRVYKLANLLGLRLFAKVQATDTSLTKKRNQIVDLSSQPDNSISYSIEDSLKRTIEINPKSDQACVQLSRFYIEQKNPAQAEKFFRRAIELNPNNNKIYLELGWFYKFQRKPLQAEESFKKAIELNSKDYKAYYDLGKFYSTEEGKLSQAEAAFSRATELNPNNYNAFYELGTLYRNQGAFPQAEEFFREAIKLEPDNDKLYGALAIVYSEMGKYDISQEYSKKANGIREKVYNPMTLDNYRKLKEALDRRGIRLVCVQYPMRSIASLKKMFLDQEGIVFVDNEQIFKEAVNKTNYKDYFIDIFGGDIGHFTLNCNRLLAKNIADVILKEVFNQ